MWSQTILKSLLGGNIFRIQGIAGLGVRSAIISDISSFGNPIVTFKGWKLR